MQIISQRSAHSARLERWVGADQIEQVSRSMKGWYGPPIHLLDVPGSVRVGPDGDFIGQARRGGYFSAIDALEVIARRVLAMKVPRATLGTGLGSISDALLEATGGKRQWLGGGGIQKVGTTGVVGGTNSLWRVGAQPAAGAAASAAPGGTVPTSATTGALVFNNPSGSDTSHLTFANMLPTASAMSLLLYDRIFAVAKTMNSTATEAVTGVPTRYQSTTPGAQDYAGGNFLFPECGTALAATAHNWTTCLYTDQAGTTGQTLPSVTGNSSNIVNRADMPTGQWFCPLASGGTGIKALTQMQCSAAVATGAIDFVIGHPIGFLCLPLANFMTPISFLTDNDQGPRIFDSACLALLEVCKSATTATTYTGSLTVTQG